MKFIKSRYRTIIITVLCFIVYGNGVTVTRLQEELYDRPVETITETVVETKTVEVAPQACLDLVSLDNRMFSAVGTYFERVGEAYNTGDIFEVMEVQEREMTTLLTFIEANTMDRLLYVSECK